MSCGRRRGASRRRTHSTKNRVLTARHLVFSVTQPVRRIAPINVKFSPQFIGRGSTYSWPRRTHAWERPIARFAPASSEHHQTGRINRPHPSQERGAFRVDVGPVDFARAPAFFLSTYPARRTARTILERLTRPPRGDASVVRPTNLLGGRVGTRRHDGGERHALDRRVPPATLRQRCHVAGGARPLHPS